MAVRGAVEERLVAQYPRLRQRVAEPAVALPPMSVPQWVDDADFRFEDHLRPRRATGTWRRGCPPHAYLESHVGEALDPAHLLWQIHFIDNYRSRCSVPYGRHLSDPGPGRTDHGGGVLPTFSNRA